MAMLMLRLLNVGFANWKDASGDKGAFSSHEHSSCHKKAVEVVVTLPKATKDVGKCFLLYTHLKEKMPINIPFKGNAKY